MTPHSASTSDSEPVTVPHTETRLSMDNHGPLPSYEEATGLKDVSRLPPYRRSRPAPRRHGLHPYCRQTRHQPARVNGTDVNRFINTVYDDERVDVVAPPALAWGPPPVRPLVPTSLPVRREIRNWPFDHYNNAGNALDEELRQADIIELDRRIRASPDAVLQEFMEGLRRANHAHVVEHTNID